MADAPTPPLLSIEGLVKHFRSDGLLRSGEPVRAVDGVELAVQPGEVLAIVGESGSGKSTLTRCVLGLERPTGGRILFDGIEVAQAGRAARRRQRRGMQPVFQDPYSSLDPRWPVRRSVRETLDVHRIGTPAERDWRVLQLLERVGLPGSFSDRRPHELSGGQRQRVCIAAALAPEPKLLVADEAVTALDVSVQAQILNLVHDIQQEMGLAVLFVAHDLSVVAHVSDRIAVMYRGKIVELGTTDDIFDSPTDPYTRSLLAASPSADPTAARR
jgi:ABC-type glutathione transport system ATPase component